MTTLGDVIRAAAKQYSLAFEQVGEEDYQVTMQFEDGRSQVVNAFVAEDPDGESWVVVRSEVGDVHDLDPVDLLEHNTLPTFAFVAVDGDVACVLAQLPLEHVNIALCQRMLIDVGRFADTLEEEMLGQDDA